MAFAPGSGSWPSNPRRLRLERLQLRLARLGRMGNEISESSSCLSSKFANPLARRAPMVPATAPRTRNTTEKMRLTRPRVAPSVFRITTSRMRRKRVPATLEARIMAPARIANMEMKPDH